MKIKRDFYLNKLISKEHNGLIKVITGDFAADLFLIGENLIRIENEKQKADPKKFTVYIRSEIKDESKYYLLLDEVQLLD